jgi:hypothetical protein
MSGLTSKALDNLEQRMVEIGEDSIRHKILQSAKNFKSSWIDLGQSLYSVWKDKLYKEWGYMTFEAYTAKEIGIKKTTALKLLKSYYFLEKEEPDYLKNEQSGQTGQAAATPSYEAVNLLRLAKDKKMMDEHDYRSLKREVLESGKDAGEVRKSLTGLMKQREELDPDEARQKKRVSVLKRLVGTLRTLKTEIESSKMLPAAILKDTLSLIARIESEID